VVDTFPQLPEYPQAELLAYEKELFGFYLTQHPMARALDQISQQADRKIGDIDPQVHTGQTFVVGGILTEIREVRTKKNNDIMAFGVLEDQSGKIRVVCFPQTFAKSGKYFVNDTVVLVRGKLDVRDDEAQIVAEKVWVPSLSEDIETESPENAVEVTIPRGVGPKQLQELGALLRKSPGKVPLVLLIPSAKGDQVTKMKLPYTVNWNADLEQYVQRLLQK